MIASSASSSFSQCINSDYWTLTSQSTQTPPPPPPPTPVIMSSHPPSGASVEDPSAPCPVGPMMQPAVGVPLESRQDWHRNLEAAIQHHSSTLTKSPAISTVDMHGKVSVAVTYGEGLLCIYIKHGWVNLYSPVEGNNVEVGSWYLHVHV